MNWKAIFQTVYKFCKGAIVGAAGGVTVAASSGAPLGRTALIAAAVGGAGHALFNVAEQQGGATAQAASLIQTAAPVVATLTTGQVQQIAAHVAAAIAPPGAPAV